MKTLLLKAIKILLIVLLVSLITLYILYHITTSVTKNTDTYEYSLPFREGTKHLVAQGYGGLFTHQHVAALDFDMPTGTPVYAAREGTVYSYKDDSNDGGVFASYKRKANYIIIKHDDGSFGCYWHLQQNGVLVKQGRVAKGQQIALSGATGQVLQPHLHFSVKSRLNYKMDSFRKTKFRTTIGLVFLEQGATYERPTE